MTFKMLAVIDNEKDFDYYRKMMLLPYNAGHTRVYDAWAEWKEGVIITWGEFADLKELLNER